jgi:predicted GNAT superfamily acetyltransferase
MDNKYSFQNRGLIVKSKLNKDFAIIPNKLLRDTNLSLKAKGLICILLSLPDDWAVYKGQLQQFSSDGRDATINSFNELLDKGYITGVQRINSRGQFDGWDYVVYSESVLSDTENPIPENPISDNLISDNPS